MVIELDAIVVDNTAQQESDASECGPRRILSKTSVSSSVDQQMYRKKKNACVSVEFSPEGPTFSDRSTYYGGSSASSSDSEVFTNWRSRRSKAQEAAQTPPAPSGPSSLRLVCPSLATVMILDDDHHGIFSLTERSVCLMETVGTYNMQIMRWGGSRGRISLLYCTEEGK